MPEPVGRNERRDRAGFEQRTTRTTRPGPKIIPDDLFGASAERRMERSLITDYEASLDRLIAGLTPERLSLAVKIAQVPAEIRGFGHVKDAAVKTAKTTQAALWAKWGKTLLPEGEDANARAEGVGR